MTQPTPLRTIALASLALVAFTFAGGAFVEAAGCYGHVGYLGPEFHCEDGPTGCRTGYVAGLPTGCSPNDA